MFFFSEQLMSCEIHRPGNSEVIFRFPHVLRQCLSVTLFPQRLASSSSSEFTVEKHVARMLHFSFDIRVHAGH